MYIFGGFALNLKTQFVFALISSRKACLCVEKNEATKEEGLQHFFYRGKKEQRMQMKDLFGILKRRDVLCFFHALGDSNSMIRREKDRARERMSSGREPLCRSHHSHGL